MDSKINLLESYMHDLQIAITDYENQIAEAEKEFQEFNRKENKTKRKIERIEKIIKEDIEKAEYVHYIDWEQESEIQEVIYKYSKILSYKKLHRQDIIDNLFLIEGKYGYSDVTWKLTPGSNDLSKASFCLRQSVVSNKRYAAELKKKVKDKLEKQTEELKKYFAELDECTKRYYKNGISKENLKKIIHLLNQMYEMGNKKPYMHGVFDDNMTIKTLTVSYYTKIEKWKNKALEIPEDMEKKYRDAENDKRKELLLVLNNMVDQKNDFESQLKNLKCVKLLELENNLKIVKRDLEENSYNKIRSDINENFEKIATELKVKITALMAELQKIEQALKSKENELLELFFFSFKKKKICREEIENLYSVRNDVKANIEKTKKDLEKESSRKQTKLNELNAEITKNTNYKTFLINSIETAKTQICILEKKLTEIEPEIVEKKKKLNNFHTLFLLEEYGDKDKGEADIVYNKTLELEQLKTELEKMQNEYSSLEDEIKHEKEKIQQLKAEAEEKEKQKELRRFEMIKRQKEKNDEEIRKKQISRKAMELFAEDSGIKDIVENDERISVKTSEDCPLAVVGECLISNNVFKLTLTQMREFSSEYTVCFVDENEKQISNKRNMKFVTIGEQVSTGVTLLSNIDFTTMDKCYLKIEMSEKEKYLIPYKMNISFYSDFD